MSDAPGLILIVDDEAYVQRTMTRILERVGHEVIVCGSCEEVAERLARGLKPDLVITDVVLEGSTGKRVASVVRMVSPRSRIVFMSGYEKVVVPGHLVLHKPFTPRELVELVDQVLSADSDEAAVKRYTAFAASRRKERP